MGSEQNNGMKILLKLLQVTIWLHIQMCPFCVFASAFSEIFFLISCTWPPPAHIHGGMYTCIVQKQSDR